MVRGRSPIQIRRFILGIGCRGLSRGLDSSIGVMERSIMVSLRMVRCMVRENSSSQELRVNLRVGLKEERRWRVS